MIVRLSGGLGNQFFQYAFGRAYEEKTGEKVSFDTWSFFRDKLRKYELDNYVIKKGPKRILRRIVCNIIWELEIHTKLPNWVDKLMRIEYEREVFIPQLDFMKDAYAIGFWQNEDYFFKYEAVIRKELVYKGPLSEKQKEIIQEMSLQQAVAIHIRRTDYLTTGGKKVYENVDKEYYLAAIEYIAAQLGETPVFYVFSDDIEWCKKEFRDIENLIFVDSSISYNQHTDLELMRNCKHFIIANSTFSWWGAWLSENQQKIVVCPKKWLVNCEANTKIINALARNFIQI